MASRSLGNNIRRMKTNNGHHITASTKTAFCMQRRRKTRLTLDFYPYYCMQNICEEKQNCLLI